MFRYLYLDNADLEAPTGGTVHTHFNKGALPDMKIPTPGRNRAERRHNRTNYGSPNQRWQWNARMSSKQAAGLADLVNAIARAGNSWATRHGLERRIKALEPKMLEGLERIDSAHGVLILAQYMRWRQRDFTGARATSAMNASIAAFGITPPEAYETWTSQPRLIPAAPKGWTTHNVFVWAEPVLEGVAE